MKTLHTQRQNEFAYQRAIKEVVSKNGWDLEALSHETPTLVVFLRHLNCIYCRESLAELKRLRGQIEAAGVRIAAVHMGTEAQAKELLSLKSHLRPQHDRAKARAVTLLFKLLAA